MYHSLSTLITVQKRKIEIDTRGSKIRLSQTAFFYYYLSNNQIINN